LHIMTNAVVFLTLIMIATTEFSPAKAQRRKEES